MLAVQVEGAQVTTIEGLATDDKLHPMQEAFREHHGLQCGFCTPGMVMSAVDLAKQHKNPDRAAHPPLARRQYLPLHRLSQHRQGDQSRGRSDGPGRKMSAPIGAPVRRKEDASLPDGPGHLYRRHQPAGPAPRRIPAQPACPCRDRARSTLASAKAAPGVVADLYRRRSAGRARPALRLGRQVEGRLADGGAAASRAGARPGAPCRRSRRHRHRRDARPAPRTRRN